MSTPPGRVSQGRQTAEESQKGTSPPSQCRLSIGQSGPDGDEEDDPELPVCRICYEGDHVAELLEQLCRCKGSMGHTHRRCLERWLDTSQKTRCELCGYDYHVELTRKYSVLPSLRVWVRDRADLRLLVIDVLIMVCMTPLIGVYVYLSIRGVVALTDRPLGIAANETATEPLTSAGLLVLCVITVICYIIWICVTIGSYFSGWYDWWNTCYRIRLVTRAVDDDQRPSLEHPAARDEIPLHRGSSSLERAFSRGANIQQTGSV